MINVTKKISLFFALLIYGIFVISLVFYLIDLKFLLNDKKEQQNQKFEITFIDIPKNNSSKVDLGSIKGIIFDSIQTTSLEKVILLREFLKLQTYIIDDKKTKEEIENKISDIDKFLSKKGSSLNYKVNEKIVKDQKRNYIKIILKNLNYTSRKKTIEYLKQLTLEEFQKVIYILDDNDNYVIVKKELLKLQNIVDKF